MKGEESKSDKLLKKKEKKKQGMTTSSYMPLRTSVQVVYSLLPRAFLLLVILPTKCFVSQDFISNYLSITCIKFKFHQDSHFCLLLQCSIPLNKTQQLPFSSFFNQNKSNPFH